MKRIFLLSILSLFSVVSFAQGINFTKGSYEEIKALAKKEGKAIFVDVYTTWCGPCKKMSNEIFPLKVVGDYYNAKFINVKLDAENEKAHGFFKQYKATSFPSFFYLDADGNLLDKQGGTCPAEVFIARGEKALKSNLGAEQKSLADRWNGGEKTFELLNEYVFKVLAQDNPSLVGAAVNDFFNSLSDEEKLSYDSFNLLKNNLSGGDMRGGAFDVNDYLIFFNENINHFEKFNSKYDITIPSLYSKMYTAFVRSSASSYLMAKDEKAIKAADKAFKDKYKKLKKIDFKYLDVYKECVEAEKLLYTGRYSEGIDAVDAILKKYGEEHPYLYSALQYSLALSNYFVKGDGSKNGTMLEIAKTALKINPNQSNLFYYAMAEKFAGNVDVAFTALATMRFYSGNGVSNAIYRYYGLGNTRAEYPETNPNVVKAQPKLPNR